KRRHVESVCEPTCDRAEERDEDEGSQPPDPRVGLRGLALLALDADERTDEKGIKEFTNRPEVESVVHDLGSRAWSGPQARIPPSTGNATPFTYDASSLARKSAACAMSSGWPTRAAGIDLRVRAKSASRPPSASAKGSRIGVSVRPGQSALQRIPRPPYARATWRTSMITPAFATWYAGLPVLACRPATDAVARRTPRPDSSIGRRAARKEKNTPVGLTRGTSAHASAGCWAHGARTPAIPAFAHSTSIRPWRLRVSATTRSTERSSPTSAVTAMPLVSAATAAAASPLRSPTTTRAPPCAPARPPA